MESLGQPNHEQPPVIEKLLKKRWINVAERFLLLPIQRVQGDEDDRDNNKTALFIEVPVDRLGLEEVFLHITATFDTPKHEYDRINPTHLKKIEAQRIPATGERTGEDHREIEIHAHQFDSPLHPNDYGLESLAEDLRLIEADLSSIERATASPPPIDYT